MPESRHSHSETLLALIPWIIASIACVLAFVLLAQFIDTLHEQMQRGQALRADQSASVATPSAAMERPVAADRIELAGMQP